MLNDVYIYSVKQKCIYLAVLITLLYQIFFFLGGGGGFFLEVHDTVLKYHYDTRTEIQAILKMKYLATQVGS